MYPHSMFLSRNKKNNVYPCKRQFYYIKVGFKGVNIIAACFRDVYSDQVSCYPALCSSVHNDSISGQRRLIWALAVRICPKTRFGMVRPIARGATIRLFLTNTVYIN